MLETELFHPIKALLEKHEYHIKGEVNHVDVFGVRNDQTIAVELKVSISLKLIYQALERTKVADVVFVGVPDEAIQSHRSDMKHLRLLLKRLNIGLIVVKDHEASIVITPITINPKKINNHKNRQLLKEFNQRQNHQNIGGTRGKKITAYKEKTIRVAYMLSKMKEASPKQLKQHTGIQEASNIIQKNHEGWFERIERGSYRLTQKGESELKSFLTILDLQ